MRKATLINQDWLRSKTMALAGEVIENIAFRLLLISDDFGRFPDDPEGLRVMMNDVRHTPEQIKEAIDYLVDARTVERYVARHDSREQAICCWAKWDDYQNIKWHDDAKYPDIEGKYEVSNNPRTVNRRADKRNVERTVKRHVARDVARHVERTVPQKEKEKEKESESESESRACAGDIDVNQRCVPRHVERHVEDSADAENASLLEEMGLVQEIFPMRAKDTEKMKNQVAAILELEAEHDFSLIKRVCKWGAKDKEFYQIKFISFTWLLEPGTEDLTHFEHMLRQYEIRGPQIGEDGTEIVNKGPWICRECGNEFYARGSKGGRPPDTLTCPECGSTGDLADDWGETPLEDEK